MTILDLEVLNRRQKGVEVGSNLLELHFVDDQPSQVAVDRSRRSRPVLVLLRCSSA